MIDVWRITNAKYADIAFSGEGARRAGGRFNSPGRAVVYTSGSLALAQLEILVNLPTDRLLGNYVGFRVRIPESTVHELARDDLPEDWRADPAPRFAKALGDQWLASGEGIALRVPSAVVPAENNYLLRPSSHPLFGELEVSGSFDPRIDPRLQ